MIISLSAACAAVLYQRMHRNLGKNGNTVLLHHICHKEIHASLSEAELARDYNTPENLRAHPRLAKFIRWVQKRPPQFTSRVPGKRL